MYTRNMGLVSMKRSLSAAGVALLAVMAHPEVDPTRTVSNHLIEIIDVLGIEAARNALMKVYGFVSILHDLGCCLPVRLLFVYCRTGWRLG